MISACINAWSAFGLFLSVRCVAMNFSVQRKKASRIELLSLMSIGSEIT